MTIRVITLKDLYTRDKGVCWICGEKVVRTQATRSHIWPVMYGGPNHEDNFRLAHVLCNRTRVVKNEQRWREMSQDEGHWVFTGSETELNELRKLFKRITRDNVKILSLCGRSNCVHPGHTFEVG